MHNMLLITFFVFSCSVSGTFAHPNYADHHQGGAVNVVTQTVSNSLPSIHLPPTISTFDSGLNIPLSLPALPLQTHQLNLNTIHTEMPAIISNEIPSLSLPPLEISSPVNWNIGNSLITGGIPWTNMQTFNTGFHKQNVLPSIRIAGLTAPTATSLTHTSNLLNLPTVGYGNIGTSNRHIASQIAYRGRPSFTTSGLRYTTGYQGKFGPNLGLFPSLRGHNTKSIAFNPQLGGRGAINGRFTTRNTLVGSGIHKFNPNLRHISSSRTIKFNPKFTYGQKTGYRNGITHPVSKGNYI